jgi:hemolysin activation/secretion protein
MTLDLEAGYTIALDNESSNFPYLKASLGLAQALDGRGQLVIANRIGYHKVFTDDYAYFQAPTLGGFGPTANLRGFRRERFSGGSAFYLNNDVRLRLIDFDKGSLPFTLGVLAGFDLGRVWVEGEASEKWHRSYGGGIWVSPFKVMTINFSVFTGDGDSTWNSFGAGFFF